MIPYDTFEYIDITPTLNEKYAVWPGDHKLLRNYVYNLDNGDSATVSTFTATAHLGAHADAPCHFIQGGASIDSLSLNHYMGLCQVVKVEKGAKELVLFEDLPPITAPRVLIRTDSCLDRESFNPDFPALDPLLIDKLHAMGVKTIGIDTPSIDLYTQCSAMPSHKKAFAYGIAVLENLELHNVAEGRYELIALPLKLEGFDAAPVRAILKASLC